MQDGDGDPDNDVYRSTHLTLQEYFAARQCYANARASGDLLQSLVKGEDAVFGLHPSPWLREVLLMVSELLQPEEFEQLARFYLDSDDKSGAAAVRVTTMLRCRREDTSQGVGARIQQLLAASRDAEMMVQASCHPCDDLRTQGLTEILEYKMPQEPVVTGLLEVLQPKDDSARPWYLRLGAARSLGKLQAKHEVKSEAVVAALVGVGFDRSQPRDLREEALRALKTMEMHDSDAVADAAVALLGKTEADRMFAWAAVKAMDSSSHERVIDALELHMRDNSEVARYVQRSRPSAVSPPFC